MVPAARGTLAVRVETVEERITAFRRTGPTDHLIARRGILEQSLSSLPAYKRGDVEQLIAILDPCRPIHVMAEAMVG